MVADHLGGIAYLLERALFITVNPRDACGSTACVCQRQLDFVVHCSHVLRGEGLAERTNGRRFVACDKVAYSDDN